MQPLEEAKPAIQQQLEQQLQQESFSAFLSDYRDRWTELTICGDDYLMERCDNADTEITPCPDPTLPEDQQKQQLEQQGCPPPVLSNSPAAPGRSSPFTRQGQPQRPHPAGEDAAPAAAGPARRAPGRRRSGGARRARPAQQRPDPTRAPTRLRAWTRSSGCCGASAPGTASRTSARSSRTVEEANEVAEAAREGDDAALHEELGDLLFQVWFLALLMEERGAGDIGTVADSLREKLIRRHPHVFGDESAETVEEAIEHWRRAKREEP